MLVFWYYPRGLWDYTQFFSFFLLYSAFQQLFPPLYLPVQWFVLLLIFSRVFLISVIVLFVSVCLFFHSFRSLLIDSCIFSILFSRFLIIFTIIILDSFSGSLPESFLSYLFISLFISFLLIYLDFCVSSLPLYLCSISLPFHFVLNLLCLRSVFPTLQGWILSSFWFLPS